MARVSIYTLEFTVYCSQPEYSQLVVEVVWYAALVRFSPLILGIRLRNACTSAFSLVPWHIVAGKVIWHPQQLVRRRGATDLFTKTRLLLLLAGQEQA